MSEHPNPNTGDVAWDRQAGEAVAVTERIVPNTGDAVWDRHAGEGAWTLNKSGLGLVVKNTSITAVGKIAGIYRNCR